MLAQDLAHRQKGRLESNRWCVDRAEDFKDGSKGFEMHAAVSAVFLCVIALFIFVSAHVRTFPSATSLSLSLALSRSLSLVTVAWELDSRVYTPPAACA